MSLVILWWCDKGFHCLWLKFHHLHKDLDAKSLDLFNLEQSMHVIRVLVSEEAVAFALVRLCIQSKVANVSILLELLYDFILASLDRNRS